MHEKSDEFVSNTFNFGNFYYPGLCIRSGLGETVRLRYCNMLGYATAI